MLQLGRAILFPIISLFLICVMMSCAAPGNTSRTSGGDIDAFRSALEKSDFTTNLAPFLQADLIKLYEVGKLGNAGGNNADAPYRAIFASSTPSNVEIKNIKQFSGAQDKIYDLLYNTPGLLEGWQLNPDEAIVIVAKTPPECVYFSYCGFIFYKYYEKEQQRKWVWTSYNDPLNNLTIKTSGTPDGVKGNPFNQDTIIIITADKGTDQRIRSAAEAAGYPANIINTYIIPSSMVKMGI